MRNFIKILLVFVFASASLFAQAKEEMISWKLSVDANAVKENVGFDAKLTAELSNGWHLYSISQPSGGPLATSIKVKDGQPFKFAEGIKASPPFKNYDNNFRMETEFYQDKAEFILPISATANVDSAASLIVEITFQLCNDESCLPPTKVEVSAVPLVPTVQTVDLPKPPAASKSSNLAVGDTVADFSFIDFTGKPRKFSEFKGKIVLLDFWATWCSPCLKDIPKLKILYDKYKAQGFEIIGMDSETIGDDETPDPEFAKETAIRAKEIVKVRGANWTHATAETAVPIAKKIFDVKALPTKILIDKSGKIVAKIGEKDDLEKAINDLMSAK